MEDRVKLTADDSDYQQVMRRAGATADAFGGKINRVSHGFEQLFKRAPGRRAELAVHGLTEALASGDISSGLAAFAGRISGLGLAIGVGIGAGVAIFSKLREQILATAEAQKELHKQLDRPLAQTQFLGPAGLASELAKTTAATEELATKRKSIGSRLFSGISSFVGNHLGVNPFSQAAGNLFNDTSGRDLRAGEKQSGALAIAHAISEVGAANLKAAQAQRPSLQTDLAAADVAYKRRNAQIELESGLTKPGRDAGVLFRRLAASLQEKNTDIFTARAKERERLADAAKSREDRAAELSRSILTTGNAAGAAILKARARGEARRLRNGKAADDFNSGVSGVISDLADDIELTPDQRQANAQRQRDRGHAEAVARARLKDLAERRARGAHSQTEDATTRGAKTIADLYQLMVEVWKQTA